MTTKQLEKDNTEEICADQWHTMTLQQLNRERDKIVSKMGALQSLFALGGSPDSLLGLYKALEYGLQTVTNLIENRSQQ